MATGTAGTDAREFVSQQVHYLRKDVAFDTAGITSGVAMPNPLPAGAQILSCLIKVTTAFNDSNNDDTLSVGTNASDYNNIMGTADSDAEVASDTAYIGFAGCDLSFSSDTDVFIKYTGSGADASAGAATVVLTYAADNDG